MSKINNVKKWIEDIEQEIADEEMRIQNEVLDKTQKKMNSELMSNVYDHDVLSVQRNMNIITAQVSAHDLLFEFRIDKMKSFVNEYTTGIVSMHKLERFIKIKNKVKEDEWPVFEFINYFWNWSKHNNEEQLKKALDLLGKYKPFQFLLIHSSLLQSVVIEKNRDINFKEIRAI